MIPTEDAKLILRWIEYQIGSHYYNFRADFDPKKRMVKLTIFCRVCYVPVIQEMSWKYAKWDKFLAESLLGGGQIHMRKHQKGLILPL
jgi:hypothetical protein